MLTNTTPFSGSPACVAGQHPHAPLPIDRLRHLSLPVFSLVTHLLEKDLNDRPQTAEELLALLSSTTRSLGNPLAASGEVRRPRSPTRSLRAYVIEVIRAEVATAAVAGSLGILHLF